MLPHPVYIGLTICDAVIVEERTRKPSTIGAFLGMGVDSFPAYPPPFSVFAVLTEGQGEGTITLVVTHLETGNRIYTQDNRVVFPGVLRELHYHLRPRTFSFPEAGWYQFTILVDGDWVAHRRLHVYLQEN